MELMVPHTCQHCGAVDEARFVFSGPHIKQLCNSCGKYIKFFHKGSIPDVREIRLRIWLITQDVELINDAKKRSGFVENMVGVDAKMVYWRLYLKIREMEGVVQ